MRLPEVRPPRSRSCGFFRAAHESLFGARARVGKPCFRSSNASEREPVRAKLESPGKGEPWGSPLGHANRGVIRAHEHDAADHGDEANAERHDSDGGERMSD